MICALERDGWNSNTKSTKHVQLDGMSFSVPVVPNGSRHVYTHHSLGPIACAVCCNSEFGHAVVCSLALVLPRGPKCQVCAASRSAAWAGGDDLIVLARGGQHPNC